jgi:apolipoprotein N-acyltransferase
VIVSQPNVDPYNEKFSGEGNMQQIQKFLIPIKEKLTSKTDLIIGPETAIPMNLWETNLDSTYEIKYLKGISKENRNIPILLGASTCKLYSTNETVTSRKVMNSHFYYDSYNTALWINNEYQTALYHKSKLVPGVEIIPFPGVMKYFEKFAIDLGGTIGSLGIQESRDVFRSAHSPICAAPIICYESIYGEFVGKYVQNGANLLCIITNDGWWDNTAGYKQHLNYARLRAIENRRWIARSANTGISAFIDEQGNIVSQSNWWVSTALRMDVKLQTKKTFYTMHGDFIYRISTYLLIATFLLILLIHAKKRFN